MYARGVIQEKMWTYSGREGIDQVRRRANDACFNQVHRNQDPLRERSV